MSEPDRKEAQRKTRRGRRRPAARQRAAETEKSTPSEGDEQATETKAEQSPSKQPTAKSQPQQAATDKEAKDARPAADDSNVSSLLETSSNEVKQLLAAADEAAAKIREAAQAEEATGESESAQRGEAISLITRTNKEVQKVLEAAEEAGEKIRDEARVEARQLIEDARRQAQGSATEQMDRISQMTGELLGELGGMQERLDALRAAFNRAVDRMGAELATPQAEVWDAKNGAPEDEEETTELRRRLGRRRKAVPPKEPEGVSEGARLLALQQLMAGVDAKVIEERLTKEFGIKDPKPILEWMGVEGYTPQDRQRKPEKS